MKDAIDIVRTIKDRITRHNAPIFATGIAFFAFLALIPALTALIGVYAPNSTPNSLAGIGQLPNRTSF